MNFVTDFFVLNLRINVAFRNSCPKTFFLVALKQLCSETFVWTLTFVTSYYFVLLLPFQPHFLEPFPPSSPRRSPRLPRPSLYLLSLCEYFTLLLPLVRDAGDWALIVCTQCGCCGMRLPGVWCVVTGVWLLTPAGRLPVVCLSVQLHLTDADIAIPTHTCRRTCTHAHIHCTTWHGAQNSN